MTGQHGGPTEEPERPVEQATADVERLRQFLLGAGRGESDPAELRDELQAYWNAHGPVLRALATSLGDQLRVQLLRALYDWRASLISSETLRRRSSR